MVDDSDDLAFNRKSHKYRYAKQSNRHISKSFYSLFLYTMNTNKEILLSPMNAFKQRTGVEKEVMNDGVMLARVAISPRINWFFPYLLKTKIYGII